MKLRVVIPALNEAPTIGEVIRRIPRQIAGVSEVGVIVVDDGSTDATRATAEAAGAVVVRHNRNRGVGAAFHTGVEKALDDGADLMVNIDADGQFAPEDIPQLLAPILNGEADFVTASRFIDRGLYPDMPRAKFWGNRMMSALISFLAGEKYHDVSCGFRAYTRDALLRLNLFGRFTYTQETFLDLSFKGLEIREVPIRVRGERATGKSRVASNLWRYAGRTTQIIFRSFRDYRPMRVFGPVALFLMALGLLLGSFLLIHYLRAGSLTPHKWAGFTAAFAFTLGFLVLTTGLVADMLASVRMNQERILYLLKKRK